MNRDTMAPPIRFKSRLLCIALAPLFLAACDASAPAPPPEEPPLAGADIGGPFELTGEDGKTYGWDDFDGKYRIVYFGYAYCPDVCPTDVQRMAQGLRLFETESPELARQILDGSGYTGMWQAEKSTEAAGRLENLSELVRAMEEYENLGAFLEHVSLVMDNEGAREDPKVTNCT